METDNQVGALTTSQAASYVGLATGSLEKMRVYGGGPLFCRLGANGGAVRYRPHDLDNWMAARVVGSTAQKVST